MSKHAEFPGVNLSCRKTAAGSNNFTKWQAFVSDNIGPKYGHVASIIRTNVPYVVGPVEEQDYTPDNLPEEIIFTEANRRELFMEAFCRNKDEDRETMKKRQIAKESPSFFLDLWIKKNQER